MEPLKTYMAKEGWRQDWQKTKERWQPSRKEGLADLVNSPNPQSGNAAAGVILAIATMPVSALAFSYVGEGFGWLWGNIVDFIPYVNDVAPWCAERSGLVANAGTVADINENLYQTTGAVGGFWGGMAFPWRVLAEYLKHN